MQFTPAAPPITLQKLPPTKAEQVPTGAPAKAVQRPRLPTNIEHWLFWACAEQNFGCVPGGTAKPTEQLFLFATPPPPNNTEQRTKPPVAPVTLKVEQRFCPMRVGFCAEQICFAPTPITEHSMVTPGAAPKALQDAGATAPVLSGGCRTEHFGPAPPRVEH